jgi:PE-PPE domain
MASSGSWRGKFGRLVALFAIAAIGLAAPANATSMLWVGGYLRNVLRSARRRLQGCPDHDHRLSGIALADHRTAGSHPRQLRVDRHCEAGQGAAGDTPGPRPLVVIGTSQGALVVQQAEADLNNDPRVPSDTTFILIADPNLGVGRGLYGVHIPVLNYTPAALPETRFNTIVVINQYDGFADPITRPWNLLTDLNALMGIVYVHPYAQNAGFSTVPAEDITVTTNEQHGMTTVYHVPTEDLPLTIPLRQLGIPNNVVDRIDSALRPIIDRGYQNSDAMPLSAKHSAARPVSSLRPSAAGPGQSKVAHPAHASHSRRPSRS